jgi:anti-anti-sigma factor
MDSAGLQLILSAAKQAESQGKTLSLVRCSAAVIDILGLCGLDELAGAATGQEAGDRP